MGLSSLSLHNGGYLFANNNAVSNFGTNDFTVEAWVKTLTGGTIVGNQSTDGGAGNGGYRLVARPDGTVKFATDSGFGFYEVDSVPCAICDGVWHHIAAVRQGGNISLYLDGQPLSGTPRGNATPPLNVTNNLRITLGTVDQTQEPYRQFLGNIAEIRLWNCARAAQDIQNGYSRRLVPGTANLVGYWSAEYGLTLDFSSTRNAAQISGMVTASTDAPAVAPDVAAPMLFLFRGSYDTATKSGGAAGTWDPSGTLYITAMGDVVLKGQVVNGVVISGNTISWPLLGNATLGHITFLLSSTQAYYWPSGPQTKYDFQGNYQSTGSAAVDYRGVIQPTRIGCGLMLNASLGFVLNVASPAVGALVTLAAKSSQAHDHFCLYDNDQLLHMMSGLALGVQGNLTAGSSIILTTPVDDQANQSWLLGTDGLIRLSQNQALAISVDTTQNPAQLILATANAADPQQQFVTLSNSQFIWNGIAPNVLSAIASSGGIYNQAAATTKADDAPAELWYIAQNTLICDINGLALSVNVPAGVGASLGLSTFSPSNTAQVFNFSQDQLIHTASGLPVSVVAATGALVLGAATDSGPETHWTIAPTAAPPLTAPHALHVRAAVTEAVTTSATVTYKITISTGNYILAGTDDKVEIALVGTNGTSARIELKNSLTHRDPFERGQVDKFDVPLTNVGTVTDIKFWYGANNWFFNARWVVDSVDVYDPTTITTYSSDGLSNGSQFEMPSSTTIGMKHASVGGESSSMSLSKAPTQDEVTRGWVDHTWVVVTDPTPRLTYFDCAGGHDGPNTVNHLIMGLCSLNQTVKMATRFGIDPSHPYQSTYGTDDLRGIQTCGVRASGKLNWDGQCHQMANRLLYMCSPSKSISDVAFAEQPTGYMLTCMMFGAYGVGFKEYCQDNGLRIPDVNAISLYHFIQGIVQNSETAVKIVYHAITLQGATSQDAENPQGPDVKAFFQAVQAEGISNTTMASVTNLTVAQVMQEQT